MDNKNENRVFLDTLLEDNNTNSYNLWLKGNLMAEETQEGVEQTQSSNLHRVQEEVRYNGNCDRYAL